MTCRSRRSRGCLREATEGFKGCAVCRAAERAYHKQWTLHAVAAGRCTRCGRDLSAEDRRDERTRCDVCRADELERCRQQRERRPPPLRIVGCGRCGQPGHYAKTCTQVARRVA